jgi:hypothetical protein
MKRITMHLLTVLGPVCALAVFGPAAAGADPAASSPAPSPTASLISPTSSGTVSAANSTEAWAPLRAFIGSWSGVQSAAPGAADAPNSKAAKLTRKFETGLNSKHLEVADRSNGSDWALAGVISFDAGHGALVLRKFAADGKVNDLALDAAASNTTHLVFAGAGEQPGRTRVTYDRSGWNDFVERVEYAPEGKEFSLVSETKFKRKG